MKKHTENTYITVAIEDSSGLPYNPALVEAKVIKVDGLTTYVVIPGAVATIESIELDNGKVINQAVYIRQIDGYVLDILQWGIEVDVVLRVIAKNLRVYEYHHRRVQDLLAA